MRRTLALAGAAVLTVGLGTLAGPASADPGITQQGPEAVLGEIAVDLNSSSGFEGTFIELVNPDETNSVPLDNYEVSTCSATGILDTVLGTADFSTDHKVPADGRFLIANQAYADFGGNQPTADIIVDDLGLERTAGGVLLADTSASPSLEHMVKWGSPTDLDCADFDPAGVSPDLDDSINYNVSAGTWHLNGPTPQNSNS